MSYEGFDQILCQNGHLSSYDAFDSPVNGSLENDEWVCPVENCNSTAVWWTAIDTTNGLEDGSNLYPGQVELELVDDGGVCVCNCGHKHVLKEPVYKIPEYGIGNHLTYLGVCD